MEIITTEIFDNIQCNFYRDINNEILLTREQIGAALNYADPSKSIQKIHLNHKDRLEKFCIRIKSVTLSSPSQGVIEGSNLTTERVYYSLRGVMEICRWSTKPKANDFMDWVWDIVEKYRKSELSLISQKDLVPMNQTIKMLMDVLPMSGELFTTISQEVDDLHKKIDTLYDNQNILNKCISKHNDILCWMLQK